MNVDLEQAKVLKGGGFPQGELKAKEGKRVWHKNELHLIHSDNDEWTLVGNDYDHRVTGYLDYAYVWEGEWYAAPDVGELMEWLPWFSDKNEYAHKRMLHITKKDSLWRVTYGYNRGSKDHPDFWSEDTSLIEALYQAVLWVLKNKK